MLLRAVGRGASQLIASTRQRIAIRSITITRVALGGGGHHHEPQPVYHPKPGSLDWSLCGGSSMKRQFAEDPYKPTGDDYASFIGAGVFVALTIAAVLIKTDCFEKKSHFESKGHSAGAHSHSEHKKEHVKEEKKPEPVKEEKAAPAEEPKKEVEEKVVEKKEETSEPVEEKKKEPEAESSESASSEKAEKQPEAEEPAEKEEKKSTESEKVEKPSTEESKPATSSNEEKSEDSKAADEKEGQLHSEYVIIGSGTAAYYASLAIRAKKGEARVLMIGEETELPYNKPPLSKELWWYGDETSAKQLDYTSLSGKKRDIFYEVEGFFVKPDQMKEAKHGGVTLLKGKKVTKICVDDRKVILDDGSTIGYDKVLIATGVRPKKEKIFEEASDAAKEKITYYHYPADYKRVENGLADKSIKSVAIVGNGLLASELAYSIKRKYEDIEVHQVFEQTYNAEDILPEHLAKKSTEAVKSMGINIHNEEKIDGVRKCCKNVVMNLKDGKELRTDLIIVANGEDVNNEIAEASGITINTTNGGVTTDKYMKVADNVWAAGAVASFDDTVLGTRRLSTWEHAQVSGRLAGENMATDGTTEKAFWYQPSLFTKFAPKIHLNAIGECDSSLDTLSVYSEPNKNAEDVEKAVVFYKAKDDGRVVGVLLVNVFGSSLDVARRIIDDKKKIDDLKEVAKLFPLYEIPKTEEKEEKAKE